MSTTKASRKYRTDTERLEFIWRRTESICKQPEGWTFYLMDGTMDGTVVDIHKKTLRNALDEIMTIDEARIAEEKAKKAQRT